MPFPRQDLNHLGPHSCTQFNHCLRGQPAWQKTQKPFFKDSRIAVKPPNTRERRAGIFGWTIIGHLLACARTEKTNSTVVDPTLTQSFKLHLGSNPFPAATGVWRQNKNQMHFKTNAFIILYTQTWTGLTKFKCFEKYRILVIENCNYGPVLLNPEATVTNILRPVFP